MFSISYELASIIVLALLAIGVFGGIMTITLCQPNGCSTDSDENVCEALDRDTVG